MSKEIIESNIQHSKKRIEELEKLGEGLKKRKAEAKKKKKELYEDYDKMDQNYGSWEKEVFKQEDSLKRAKKDISENDRKIRINKTALDGLKASQGK